MAKKPTDLSNTINNIKKDINSGFTELLSRVRGDKRMDIAKDFGLSEGRISQIVNAGRS